MRKIAAQTVLLIMAVLPSLQFLYAETPLNAYTMHAARLFKSNEAKILEISYPQLELTEIAADSHLVDSLYSTYLYETTLHLRDSRHPVLATFAELGSALSFSDELTGGNGYAVSVSKRWMLLIENTALITTFDTDHDIDAATYYVNGERVEYENQYNCFLYDSHNDTIIGIYSFPTRTSEFGPTTCWFNESESVAAYSFDNSTTLINLDIGTFDTVTVSGHLLPMCFSDDFMTHDSEEEHLMLHSSDGRLLNKISASIDGRYKMAARSPNDVVLISTVITKEETSVVPFGVRPVSYGELHAADFEAQTLTKVMDIPIHTMIYSIEPREN